tara:strand:- start:327 stop:878 length:552 start_codon:yes stop_codon:yes gene_type:complete
MKVSVTGRKMEMTEALNDHIEEKISGIKKFLNEVKDVHIVLSVEKHRHFAEITLNASGYVIHCKEETNNMYSSIDRVIVKLTKQLKKHKDKILTLKNKKKSGEEEMNGFRSDVLSYENETSIREDHEDIKSVKFDAKPIFLEEASMEIRSSKNNFLVFRNASNGKINVLYHRNNGKLGLIDTN